VVIRLRIPHWLEANEVIEEYSVDRAMDEDRSDDLDSGVVDLTRRKGRWRGRVLPYHQMPSLSNRPLPISAQLAIYESVDPDPNDGFLVVSASPAVERILKSRHYRLLHGPINDPSNALKATGYLDVGWERLAWIHPDTAIVALGTEQQTPGNDVVYEHEGYAIVSKRSGRWTSIPFNMQGE